jgi:outer membrane biosynthesis protein TonB
MRRPCSFPLVRLGTVVALAAALVACTKGGQFDPTTLLDNDMFDTKKPVPGQRQPVFPNGVPGATTGIPADLYKGYQPPPQQAAADNSGVGAATPVTPNAGEPPKPVATVEAQPKPKPKPKPKLARAPAPPPTRISIGLRKPSQPAAQGEAQPAQAASPAPASSTAAQTAWPSPTAQAPPAQSAWPSPTAAPQQAGQPSQSIWPNPTPAGSQ